MNGNRKKVLIVDDITENIDVLYNLLKDFYEIYAAKSGHKALELIDNGYIPDLILLDVMMPEMDGFEVCRRLKNQYKTKNIPVIYVTAKDDEYDESQGFFLGAVDYITKPVNPLIVLARVKTHIALYDQKQNLEDLINERTLEIKNTRLKIIRRLAKAGEFKDSDTGLHVVRMSKYAELLGSSIGLSKGESELLLHTIPMHDIGKIGIPDSILLKPGKLSPEEWEIMKTHTLIGADIIGNDNTEIIREARICALSHHEKWDGSGYPHGLKGKDIHLYGRIAAIVDVFDALTSKRPYKKAWTAPEAMQYMINEKEKHFDPDILDAFTEIFPDILAIKDSLSD